MCFQQNSTFELRPCKLNMEALLAHSIISTMHCPYLFYTICFHHDTLPQYSFLFFEITIIKFLQTPTISTFILCIRDKNLLLDFLYMTPLTNTQCKEKQTNRRTNNHWQRRHQHTSLVYFTKRHFSANMA